MSEKVNNNNLILKNAKNLIRLRRDRILELSSRGYTQQRIADQTGVSQAVVSLDLQFLSCTAHENIKKHIEETLPLQYRKTMSGINQVLVNCWLVVERENVEDKTKLSSLSLINECYRLLMELNSDATVIERAMRFVKHNQIQILPPTKEEEDNVIEEIQQQVAGEEEEDEELQEDAS